MNPWSKRDVWAMLLLCCVVSLWALRPIWDMDLWWHIVLGQMILDTGLPTTDPLAIGREGLDWSTFQGGYEVFVAMLDGWGGLFLVRAVHALAIGVGFAFFFGSIRRLDQSPWMAMASVFLLLVVYEDRIRVRPHVFNFLWMQFLLFHLVVRDMRWSRRDLLWLAPLFVIWASFHGPASLWGLLLVGAGALGNPKHWDGWLVTAGVTVAVGVTPGAVNGLVSSFEVHTQAGVQQQFVPEHGPLFSYLEMGGDHAVLVVTLVCLSVLVWAGGFFPLAEKRSLLRAPLLLASIPMALFTFIFARFAWYMAGPLLFALSTLRLQRRGAQVALLCVCAGLFVWDSGRYVMPRYSSLEGGQWSVDEQPGYPLFFPQKAAAFLANSGKPWRVYNEVGWGGYLLYKLPVGTRTLYDSRIVFGSDAAELLKQDDRLRSELQASGRSPDPAVREAGTRNFAHGRLQLAKRAVELGADVIVRRAPFFGRGVSPPPGWVRLYGDETAEIWAPSSDKK